MDGELRLRNTTPLAPKLRRDLTDVIGGVLPAADVVSVLFAALAASALCRALDPGAALGALLVASTWPASAALVLAPMMLGARTFLGHAPAERSALLGLSFGLRLAVLLAALAALGAFGALWAGVPGAWPPLFLALLALGAASSRRALLRGCAALERKGALAESVAVLGAGHAADRVIATLCAARRHRPIEIVGVFDDRASRHAGALHRPDGTVADLIELGKRREVDWIVLALPEASEARVQALRHRLMSLATPIALAAGEPGAVPPSLLPRGIARTALALAVPYWLHVLVRRPLALLRRRARRARAGRGVLRLDLDRHDLEGFAGVAQHFGHDRYGYVVTANVDHVIRMHRWPALRKLYAEAAYALLDSRFLAHLLRLVRGLVWPVCAGSDLTARVLQDAGARDRIVLIGGGEAQAKRLAARYGLTNLAHYNPPMGFIRDPAAIEACLRFIEQASPFRYCLLAVGSPQQEFLAYCLKQRGVARGLALCIGASADFLTGTERRAPRFMQSLGFEWLFRLLQSPRRMAYRYLVRGPRIFALLHRTELVEREVRGDPLVAVPEAALLPELLRIAMPTGVPIRVRRGEPPWRDATQRDAA